MESEGISIPLLDDHLLMPWNDQRKCDCCGRYEAATDGYYCESCDFFIHKICGDEASKAIIQHPSHPDHVLHLYTSAERYCDLCGRDTGLLCYYCRKCSFRVDLRCSRFPQPEVIAISDTHHHKLILLKERIEFDCDATCGKPGEKEFFYKCHECDLTFHMDCIKYPVEVNHFYHSLHPLKLLLRGQTPKYSDGKCRLCGRKCHDFFYHCSSCNFTLDMGCTLNPPPQSLMDLKSHDHQLTLLPRIISFTCNACGLSGDRSPYICVQCDFVIHRDCLGLPRIININRHDHRVSRVPLLGVVNSVCGVCRKKVDWTCGGYSCQRCPGYVVHSKCATRKDVWNGKELEGIPEEVEDIEPYVVIDENTIQHFSHKQHNLRLHINGVLYEDNKRCRACNHPIGLQSFYGCIDCDFILHQSCAGFPKKKWHVVHNEQLTLVTSKGMFMCNVCRRFSNGFMYQHGDMKLDVLCGSVSEPFVHPSHPDPLYHVLSKEETHCKCCNERESHVLRCIEDGCEFVLGFICATFPQVVKHRVNDHPLSLCYGGEEASGKYWCDICEKETNPKTWFYTCKDNQASMHIKCVLGEYAALMPGSTIVYGSTYEVVLNNGVTRPFCKCCKSHSRYPIIFKLLVTDSITYFCSFNCIIWFDLTMGYSDSEGSEDL